MKKVFIMGLIAIGLASCTVSHTIHVTNNPVGTKTGIAKGTNFKKDLDISIEAAAKNGGITKIGTMETKTKVILFLVKYQTIVTGE